MIKITAPVRIDISAGWTDVDPYRKEYGSYVLNGAINLRVGVRVEEKKFVSSIEEVPKESGLGSSGALRACYILACNKKLYEDKNGLIKRTFALENEILDFKAGFQDEAAAIYGGVNLWKVGKGDFREVEIERFEVPRKKIKELEKRVVLINTGESRLSADILDLVFGKRNYRKNVQYLHRVKEIAKEMFENINSKEKMSDLINESWELQKKLHPLIETQKMRELQEELEGYFSACRAVGAGAGGCMIFYTFDKEKLILKAKEIEEIGIQVIPFKFECEGIRIEY